MIALPSLPPDMITLLASVFLVVLLMVGTVGMVVIGPKQLLALRYSYRRQLREVWPFLGLLILVLVVNSVARDVVPELSWLIGINITGYIYAIEGPFVATVQSFSSSLFTAYFSFMYVYGYVFLLIFPLIAYGSLDNLLTFKQLIITYICNYMSGLAAYTFFIAYGPRNLLPDLVNPLLFSTYAEYHLLSAAANANTNVFPSLHTSLSMTVALLAYETRDIYPRWSLVAAVFAVSITIATMYLGIHWAIDIVAGIVLAVGSVLIARRYPWNIGRGTGWTSSQNES